METGFLKCLWFIWITGLGKKLIMQLIAIGVEWHLEKTSIHEVFSG
jgi:hypothetical protein